MLGDRIARLQHLKDRLCVIHPLGDRRAIVGPTLEVVPQAGQPRPVRRQASSAATCSTNSTPINAGNDTSGQ